MSFAVYGAGAFGTGLAIALGLAGHRVTIIGRNAGAMAEAQKTRQAPKLDGITLPPEITLTADQDALRAPDIVLLAVPAQTLGPVLGQISGNLTGRAVVACCKGIDLHTLRGPVETIMQCAPKAQAAVLSGPSFALDLAKGMPTALTIAAAQDETAKMLQTALSTDTMRMYRSTDFTGVQLGGALKNIIAIACGVTIGAGLGDSARAALLARGFAEMRRLGAALGAQDDTLCGLSGLGDLTLTCTSLQSRNFRYGLALGAQDEGWDSSTTTEGAATARAAQQLGRHHKIETPIIDCVAGLVSGEITVDTALTRLLSRSLKEE